MNPTPDAVFAICPPPCSRMIGKTARMPYSGPKEFKSNANLQSASVASSAPAPHKERPWSPPPIVLAYAPARPLRRRFASRRVAPRAASWISARRSANRKSCVRLLAASTSQRRLPGLTPGFLGAAVNASSSPNSQRGNGSGRTTADRDGSVRRAAWCRRCRTRSPDRAPAANEGRAACHCAAIAANTAGAADRS
jgi:hypothetical protein